MSASPARTSSSAIAGGLPSWSAVESNGPTIQALRDEVAQLLADAIRVADDAKAETERVAEVHVDELHNMGLALASRDLLGQAKGIIMVTMNCDADVAFDLIRKQSQAENRKAIDIAAEIVARVVRRAAS